MVNISGIDIINYSVFKPRYMPYKMLLADITKTCPGIKGLSERYFTDRDISNLFVVPIGEQVHGVPDFKKADTLFLQLVKQIRPHISKGKGEMKESLIANIQHWIDKEGLPVRGGIVFHESAYNLIQNSNTLGIDKFKDLCLWSIEVQKSCPRPFVSLELLAMVLVEISKVPLFMTILSTPEHKWNDDVASKAIKILHENAGSDDALKEAAGGEREVENTPSDDRGDVPLQYEAAQREAELALWHIMSKLLQSNILICTESNNEGFYRSYQLTAKVDDLWSLWLLRCQMLLQINGRYQVCQNPRCGKIFVTTNSKQRYCPPKRGQVRSTCQNIAALQKSRGK